MIRTKGINVCSAFDGISGAQVALEYLGIPVDNYYSLETDKYVISVTQKNYPETIQLGDIRNVSGDQMPKIDLFVGGFPCQDLSFAGHQKGFQEGTRSSLFFEFLRLLDEIKPTYFLVENTLMKKEYQDIISEKLGVQPIMINSNLVSGQERKRNYWTNIPEVGQPEDLGIMLSDCLESQTGEILYEEPYVKLNSKTKFVDRDKSYCIDANYFKGGNLKSYFEKRRRQLVFTNDEKTTYRKLTPTECECLQTFPKGYTEGISNTQRYKALGNAFNVLTIASILAPSRYHFEMAVASYTKSV